MKTKNLIAGIISYTLLHFNTTAQISLVHDLHASGGSLPATLTEFQGKLYFSAVTPATGRELYSYDGVNPPTLVTDFNTGSSLGVERTGNYAVIGNYMYLSADDGTTGPELYRFDGTDIFLVEDIEPGLLGSWPQDFTVHDNILYFSAETMNFGTELYAYSPATNAVVRQSDIIPGPGHSLIPSNFTVKDKFGILGNKLFMYVEDATGYNIAVYNTTTNNISTLDIEPFMSSDNPFKIFHTYNNEIYFIARDGRWHLHKYTGTALINVTATLSFSNVYNIVGILNDKIYLNVSNSDLEANGELWVYDPAANTLEQVADINPTGASHPHNGLIFNGLLYFIADDGTHGKELWYTDGPTTEMVMDLNPGGSSNIGYLSIFNGKLYMAADNGSTGSELFVLESSSSIRNVMYNGTINVFPNPATDVLQINIEGGKSERGLLETYDVCGKKVHSQSLQFKNGQQNFSINIKHWNTGMYMYSFSGENGMKYKCGKIIKQ